MIQNHSQIPSSGHKDWILVKFGGFDDGFALDVHHGIRLFALYKSSYSEIETSVRTTFAEVGKSLFDA